ncbi:unnamed protein product [Rotaria sp. Silwood1]|nr:unnamed protein product [Rotaria sp. Silwood1]CAF1622011.1 unnamed protein product [Rotaria sp. Silwood1]CAF3755151.1 unnamed protein product [Rotaria sp. Silwood1]CAF3871768.1 unnamed protein product [Rotaria sp. Silwood1]CAF4927932.1 unnamed protein product [Rotaria sp. Silwood1]
MPLFKKVAICDLSKKYGDQQRGMVTLELIYQGEKVYECDPATCSYYPDDNPRFKFTRKKLVGLMEMYPQASEYIRNYAVMIEDDFFALPYCTLTQELTDECALFNHSCEPNCDVEGPSNGWIITARRDIKVGEELTIHYGIFETENSLMAGTQCMCSADNCVGQLRFDFWRDHEWQRKFEHMASPYIQKKIRELRTMASDQNGSD